MEKIFAFGQEFESMVQAKEHVRKIFKPDQKEVNMDRRRRHQVMEPDKIADKFVVIFDSSEAVADRYSVIISAFSDMTEWYMIAMSDEPTQPNGICQFCFDYRDVPEYFKFDHLGNIVPFKSMNDEVKRVIEYYCDDEI